MKYSTIYLLCLFMLSPALGKTQEIEEQIHKQLKKLLRYEVNIHKKETPGFIVAIIEPDTSFVVSYGRQVNARQLPDSSEMYEMGGLSKIYTSIVANKLHLDKIVNLDEPIGRSFSQGDSVTWGHISGRELLQHTSGIKRTLKGISDNNKRIKRGLSLHSPKGFRHEMEELTEEELFIALRKTALGAKGTFVYSHYNYALLHLWIEQNTGKSISEHAQEIQIGNTFLDRYIISTSSNIAKGISKHGRSQHSIKYGILENSIGLHSTMSLLINMVKEFYLDESNPLAKEVLSNAVRTQIGNDIYFTNGLYKISQSKEFTIYSHGGHTTSHSASIHFVPETKTGIVIFANSEIGTKDLYLALLRMINNNWKRQPYGQEK